MRLRRKALVLTSGGVDSFAAAHYMQSMQREVTCCFVDYSQPAAQLEYQSAQKIAEHLKNEIVVLKFDGASIPSDGEICSRNLFLLSAASLYANKRFSEIVIGVHSGTQYFDCSSDFVISANKVIQQGSGNTQRIVAPFLDWSKADLFSYCNKAQLPLELTYSCERGAKLPCGECLSCLDRGVISASGEASL